MYWYFKEAHYGGNTEVYKPDVKNLFFFYHVNSLYPFVAYSPKPGIQLFK